MVSIDSRFRGNDIEESGNDIDDRGNDIEDRGNDRNKGKRE